jgi:aspartokinase/homoserine dehydrogenase 1
LVLKIRTKQALNVIHGEILVLPRKLIYTIFGHGLVGGTLINQILNRQKTSKKKRHQAECFCYR